LFCQVSFIIDRWNEDFLKRVTKALDIPPYQLLADEPVIPYSEIKKHTKPSDLCEQIKFFSDPLSLGPGVEISEIPPLRLSPLPEKVPAKGLQI